MEPMRFLGIPVTPIGYYMNCVLTNAQIELIATDVSVVDYGTYKKDKKKRRKGEFDNTKADARAVKRAADEWNKRYADKGENAGWVNVRDILGGMKADVGVKIE